MGCILPLLHRIRACSPLHFSRNRPCPRGLVAPQRHASGSFERPSPGIGARGRACTLWRMTPNGHSAATPEADHPQDESRPPRPFVALVLGGLSVIVIAWSAWLAVKPGAETAQSALVLWFNHPSQPFAAIFAAANPLLRPMPLAVVSVLLLGRVLLAADGTAQRLELLRALVIALTLSELTAQGMKWMAKQPRPLSVIPGLDTHGYPTGPLGNAYPSAHTAMVVAAVSALWPWMRWPQRIVALVFAILVASNRLYIGAHWPFDVVGGAAIGLLAGANSWLVAARCPIHRA